MYKKLNVLHVQFKMAVTWKKCGDKEMKRCEALAEQAKLLHEAEVNRLIDVIERHIIEREEKRESSRRRRLRPPLPRTSFMIFKTQHDYNEEKCKHAHINKYTQSAVEIVIQHRQYVRIPNTPSAYINQHDRATVVIYFGYLLIHGRKIDL